MAGVTIRIDFQRAQSVLAAVAARAEDPRPVLDGWPELFRRGPDGIDSQVATRTYHGPHGEARPWVEPSFATGPASGGAREREEVLWNAARGSGPAAFQRVDARSASIGVDDSVIHLLSAQFGNGQVAPAEAAYFRTVTGGWDQVQTTINVRPYKLAVLPRGRQETRYPDSGGSKFKPKNVTAETRRYAMFWYLGYTYDYWPTEQELLAGIPMSPKNLGISQAIVRIGASQLGRFIATGALGAAA